MILPNFSFEKNLHKQGFVVVAGVDEVGRGAFAGPVVAGCVAFRQIPNSKLQITNNIKINDSKRLNSKQREVADKWIRKNCLVCGIGSASVSQINRFGIKRATDIAFRRAIVNCNLSIDYLLVDAFNIPYVKKLGRNRQKAIVKGDSKSISIAAASIIAKVYRDNHMVSLSSKSGYKKYKWHKNKGYGTLVHRKAIKKYGCTKLHRNQFVKDHL